jgi:hypothetical protein
MTQSTISLIVNRDQAVTALAVLERIADGLRIPDEARMRLGLAPKKADMRRRTALGLGLVGTLSPATLTDVLRESAAEALEFTRERAVSAVGNGTLEHLTAVIAELDHAYEWRPAAELFPVARAYRQRVAQLINGQHTLREARELYADAAHLSYRLSDLANDLGSRIAAEAYAIDAYRHADQAGHDELCAWACSSLTCWALTAGQVAKAVTAAERGIAKAPAGSPVAPRLHARAAQGYALQAIGRPAPNGFTRLGASATSCPISPQPGSGAVEHGKQAVARPEYSAASFEEPASSRPHSSANIPRNPASKTSTSATSSSPAARS